MTRELSRRAFLTGNLFARRAPKRERSDAVARVRPRPVQGRALRPPHALPEPEFSSRCTRCNHCVEACDVGAIVTESDGDASRNGLPVIRPNVRPCDWCDDMPCVDACPDGALSFDAPAAIGLAEIQPWLCLAHRDQLCSVCAERCPVDGALTRVDGKPVIDADRCTGCGWCAHVCPAPINAVMIRPV